MENTVRGFFETFHTSKVRSSSKSIAACNVMNTLYVRDDGVESTFFFSVYCWAMGWMIGGFEAGRGQKFFSSPARPDQFWGP